MNGKRGDEAAELARLREENVRLRRLLGQDLEDPGEPSEAEDHETWILVMPDPAAETDSSLRREAVSSLGRTTLGILRERQPDVSWRVEHDLEQIPVGSVCVQLAQVVTTLWEKPGLPPFYELVEEGGERRLERRVVPADAESVAFASACDSALQMLDDLIAEAQVAHDAEAHHHAEWTLKACDLVLSRMRLAQAYFNVGDPRCRHALAFPRPEYDPRYAVPASAPPGS